jgi:hypothetical protein
MWRSILPWANVTSLIIAISPVNMSRVTNIKPSVASALERVLPNPIWPIHNSQN